MRVRLFPTGITASATESATTIVIVEADGGQHADSHGDASRDRYLRHRGFHVLRFWNHEILGEADAVFDRILAVLRHRTKTEFHISC